MHPYIPASRIATRMRKSQTSVCRVREGRKLHTAFLLLSTGKFPFLKQIPGHCLLASDACLEFLAIPSYLGHTVDKQAQCLPPGVRGCGTFSLTQTSPPSPALGALQSEHSSVPGSAPGLSQCPSMDHSTPSLQSTQCFQGHNISPRQTTRRARKQVSRHVKGLEFIQHLL